MHSVARQKSMREEREKSKRKRSFNPRIMYTEGLAESYAALFSASAAQHALTVILQYGKDSWNI